MKGVIYVAASLFSGRETRFNIELARRLKRLQYSIKLPQRHGFEFGNLADALADQLPAKRVPSAVGAIIYFLDMGIFIPESHVILANLDEPLDEGVLVELTYARGLGKTVIGFRTDKRSPFGQLSEPLGGIHFFAAYQCHAFIRHSMQGKSEAESDEELDKLAAKIDGTIKSFHAGESMLEQRPLLHRDEIQEGAKLLFHDLNIIHAAKHMSVIVERYILHEKQLRALGPRIISAADHDPDSVSRKYQSANQT